MDTNKYNEMVTDRCVTGIGCFQIRAWEVRGYSTSGSIKGRRGRKANQIRMYGTVPDSKPEMVGHFYQNLQF